MTEESQDPLKEIPKVGIKIEPPKLERVHWMYMVLAFASIVLIVVTLVLLVSEWRGIR